jgi:hypothetical protein
MAKTVYIKKALTGGAANALDGIDGNNLTADDVAIVFHSSIGEIFELSTGASTERAPNVYTPDSNPGSFAWLNRSNWVVTTTSAPTQATLMPTHGVTIITSTKAGTYALGVPYAGAKKEVVSYSSFVIKIKSSTGVAGTIKFASSHTVISVDVSAGIANSVGRSIRLCGASTTLWRIMGGSTLGITYATAT